jgi:hypothetical protein
VLRFTHQLCGVVLESVHFLPKNIGVKLVAKAAKAKQICKQRHDDFVLNAKNNVNLLVRKKLSAAIVERREIGGGLSFADYDLTEGGSSSSSDMSDPLGKLRNNDDGDDGKTLELYF